MTAPGRTPLDAWTQVRIGAQALADYQLQRLNETIGQARSHSPFYQELLADFTGLKRLSDLSGLPFTTGENLRIDGHRMLSVSQSEISRIVTLETSGTTGPAKRLFFTEADQEQTVDFFKHGMATLAQAGDRVMILLPGQRAGGVGDLLSKALLRLGVVPIPYGPVIDLADAKQAVLQEKPDILVGIPAQLMALCRFTGAHIEIKPRSILLSTDYVCESVIEELRRSWQCKVFTHYGMTELGFGGATECSAHEGLHLYEADFYFEVIDPATGEAVPDEEEGELVASTLSRQGIPLIRYRTGDITRILTTPCPCGSNLRRVAPIRRSGGEILLTADGRRWSAIDLDEAVYQFPEVLFHTMRLVTEPAAILELTVHTTDRAPGLAQRIAEKLEGIPLSIRVETDAFALPQSVTKRSLMRG